MATTTSLLNASAVNYAKIDTATSGDQTIIAAVAGKQIVVTSYVLVNTTAQSVTWKDGSTAISGAMALAALGVVVLDSPTPCLTTSAGNALVLNLGASTQVSGHIAYILV